MTKVIAAVSNDRTAPSVLATAHAVANLYTATVEAVHVGESSSTLAKAAEAAGVILQTVVGTPVEELVRVAEHGDVAAIVLGTSGVVTREDWLDSTALALITVLEKPAVVVPPQGALSHPIARVLVPMDGAAASAAAVEEIFQLASGAAVEIVVAHVYGEAALPAFSDQLAHEVRAWSEEFIARNCSAVPDAALELRVGKPHEHVLDIARSSGCDLVALGWSQNLTRGHAAVVRHMLAESPVPVLLTPVRHTARIPPRQTAGAQR